MNQESQKAAFSNGWYRFAASPRVKKDRIYTFHYFATSFVCIRNSQHLVRVFDAYCPHLGAHLGSGQIKNDLITCPFHGWQYDASGQCVNIPYCKQIPKKAILKQYQAKELNSCIYIYFDSGADHDAPQTELALQVLSKNRFYDLLNTRMTRQRFERLLAMANSTLFNFSQFGPGLFISEVESEVTDVYFLLTATPITKTMLSVSFASSIKKTFNPFKLLDANNKTQRKFISLASEIL